MSESKYSSDPFKKIWFSVIDKVYLPRPDHLCYNLKASQKRSTIDRAAVKAILAAYELDLIGEPRVLGGGNRSYSLLVHTSAGKKILKKYKPSLGQSTIIQEHSLLTYLAQTDFPSPHLVTTATGQTLLHRGSPRLALFDYIEGGFQYYHYMLLPGQLQQFITVAGEILALLHQTVRDFAPQGYNPDGFKSQHEDRWRDLAWLVTRLEHCVAETVHLKEKGVDNKEAAWLLQQASYLEKSLIQLDAILKNATLPRLIIHGDYGPYNLLFRRNAPAIVLDFEMARLDWRLTELIGAWHRFGYSQLGRRLTRMKWLLDAYQTYFPLTKEETQLMPQVWEFLDLRQCVQNWHSYCQTGNAARLAKARYNLQTAVWIKMNQNIRLVI